MTPLNALGCAITIAGVAWYQNIKDDASGAPVTVVRKVLPWSLAECSLSVTAAASAASSDGSHRWPRQAHLDSRRDAVLLECISRGSFIATAGSWPGFFWRGRVPMAVVTRGSLPYQHRGRQCGGVRCVVRRGNDSHHSAQQGIDFGVDEGRHHQLQKP
jgi:hypothetical protein